jgi:hypothetical protein
MPTRAWDAGGGQREWWGCWLSGLRLDGRALVAGARCGGRAIRDESGKPVPLHEGRSVGGRSAVEEQRG